LAKTFKQLKLTAYKCHEKKCGGLDEFCLCTRATQCSHFLMCGRVTFGTWSIYSILHNRNILWKLENRMWPMRKIFWCFECNCWLIITCTICMVT